MSEALKPCPFCGCEAQLAGGPMAQESYSVWCVGPAKHSMDYGFDRDTAISAWNARTDLPATNAQAITNENVKVLVGVLEWLDRAGGLGLDRHERIKAALAAMESE